MEQRRRRALLYSSFAFLLLFLVIGIYFERNSNKLPATSPTRHSNKLPSLLAKRNKEEEIHIVFSSDNEDKRAVEQAVESILRHTESPVHIHYIGEEPLEYHPTVHFIDLNETIKKYNLSEFINPNNRTHLNYLNTNFPNFARLALPAILPDVSKVMYFDADTTILCDIAPLFHSILNDGLAFKSPALAAVPREGLKGFGNNPKIDIPLSFNAGVLGLRLDLWREQHLTEKIREITLSNQHEMRYKLGSQPPLAILFGDNFEHLPFSWNMPPKQNTLELAGRQERRLIWKETDKAPPEDEVCVVHWKGGIKPWRIKKTKGRPTLFRTFDVVDREEMRKETKERREAMHRQKHLQQQNAIQSPSPRGEERRERQQ